MTLTIDIVGVPAPQGSHRGFVVNGRAVITQDNKKTKPWRQDVRAAALNKIAEHPDGYPLTGPVHIEITFHMPRPGYHYRTGRHAGQLKPTAPRHVDKKPDTDKLLRSTFDALGEAGVWRDDAQVASVTATKEYADGNAGAHIVVRQLDPQSAVPAACASPVAAAGTAQPEEVLFDA